MQRVIFVQASRVNGTKYHWNKVWYKFILFKHRFIGFIFLIWIKTQSFCFGNESRPNLSAPMQMMSNQMLQCKHSLKDQAPWKFILRKLVNPVNTTWRSNYHRNVTAGQVSYCWITDRYYAKYLHWKWKNTSSLLHICYTTISVYISWKFWFVLVLRMRVSDIWSTQVPHEQHQNSAMWKSLNR